MSFRRPKPKVILADDDEEPEDPSVGSNVPVFKKSVNVSKQKRKKLNISFDEPLEEEDEGVIKINKPKAKKLPSFKAPSVDHMDVDIEEKNYSPEYIEQLKSQNKIKQEVPKNLPYKVLDVPSNDKPTIIPDEFTIKELKERSTRAEYQEMKQDLEEFISIEDQDDEFQYLDKMNKSSKNIDKHVDFEVDLHETFGDDRLPLTEQELNQLKLQKKEEIQNALDYFDEDQDEQRQQTRIKDLETIDEFLGSLRQKETEFKDMKEYNEEQLAGILQRRNELQEKQKQLIRTLNELAESYK